MRRTVIKIGGRVKRKINIKVDSMLSHQVTAKNTFPFLP
jgi:hypothetical protein